VVVPPADFVLHNSLFLIAHPQRDHRRRAVRRHGCRDLLVKAFGYKLNVSSGAPRSGSSGLLLRMRHVLGLMGDPPHEPL
jgi:hypothetical protein